MFVGMCVCMRTKITQKSRYVQLDMSDKVSPLSMPTSTKYNPFAYLKSKEYKSHIYMLLFPFLRFTFLDM